MPEDADALKAIVSVQKLGIKRLQEQMRLMLRKRLSASSEKTPVDQRGLFKEAEVSLIAADDSGSTGIEVAVPEYKRHAKRGRRSLPDYLLRMRVEHDIDETDKSSPCGSGQSRKKIDEVVTEEAEIVLTKVQVIQNMRFKYGTCDCCDGAFSASEAEHQTARD